MFVDTHCHIHDAQYPLDPLAALSRAREADVRQLICVGTDQPSSAAAIAFAALHEGVFATVGVHPHDSKDGYVDILQWAGQPKLVAVGEIGLDYFYDHSPREVQIPILEAQMQFALDQNLPIVFHVREAFNDFWPIFDNFKGIRGELHSFTDTQANLEAGLSRGLYIGVNGISTFTKDEAQQASYASIPLSKLLLETDAPFLTPAPFRGKVNEPAFVRTIAEFQAAQRGCSLEAIADATTANARELFAL